MEEEMEDTCDNCRYRSEEIDNEYSDGSNALFRNGGETVAFCLRYPPVARYEHGVPYSDTTEWYARYYYCAGFPFARKDGWCGEHDTGT